MNTTAASYSDHSWLASGSRRTSIESVLSVQGRETDVVCDTSDTEPLSAAEDGEYEPLTDAEDECVIDSDSSGDSHEIILTKVLEVKVRDDGDLVFADSEMTDSDDSDSEIDLYDYWECLQCKAKNNNPLYRYCEKCFKVRKNFFPPRPRRYKTRAKSTKLYHTDSGIESVANSQEFSQSSSQCSDILNGAKSPLWSQGVERTSKSVERSSQSVERTSQSVERTSQSVERTSQSVERSSQSVERSSQNVETLSGNRKILPLNRQDCSDDSSLSSDDSNTPNSPLPKVIKRRRTESVDENVKRIKTDSEVVQILTKTVSDPSLTVESKIEKDADNLCMVCLSEPKSGVFVHGRIAHICCCYKCAKKVWAQSKRCPLCNSKVSNVLRAVM